MYSFKKLNTKIYQKSGPVITEDYIYWKQLSAPVLVKEFGPIDYIDFSPIEPYYFATTCSVRVQVYNPITKLVVKNLSRFRENAYGAAFRSDGRLLCAGGEEKNVKLFDVSTKSLLRLFKGHEGAVHRTFFVHDRPQIASFSDDKTVKLWDIATEQALITYNEHTDYIRAGATSPVVPNIILSGGYDSNIKLYDTRTENVVLNVNHGSPVESVLFLPSGGIFLSAGGTDIKIWDTLAGGKLLGNISQHHKTITCLRLASDNKRLLSASLDRHVKIYDINNFKTVHTLDYPNGILSLGISKNDDTIVAGLVDGLISVSRREQKPNAEEEKSKKKISSFRFISHRHQTQIDAVVPELKHEKESKHDHHLRKFAYCKALDSVLLNYVANKHPEVTVSLIQELIRRRGLHKAYRGRETKSLIQILRFLIKHITDYRFTRILIDAANIFIDVYGKKILTLPLEVQNLFIQLSDLIREEIDLVNDLNQLQGAMHLLLSSSEISKDSNKSNEKPIPHNLTPSINAQRNLVSFTVD